MSDLKSLDTKTKKRVMGKVSAMLDDPRVVVEYGTDTEPHVEHEAVISGRHAVHRAVGRYLKLWVPVP
jgi:hypothetical protein